MSHHVLIVGRPGSGKSNLMHVIITSLALTYSPDEMRVYLIDFKKGVEFKSYADHKLPHADAIAVESEREFGLSVVERLDVELKSRGDLFRAAGAASVTEYREKTKIQIPRILLIVDEFQEFFTQDDHVARQTTLILDRLVRQGRAFGIHIMLGSQTLAGSYNLPKSTLDQMAVRIAMQCSEADSRLVLADDNPAARLLSRPGEAIYNAASGLVEGNNLFQVARFNDEDREERLRLITEIAQRSNKPVPVPIVFEGNELAPLEDCRSLTALLSAPDWPGKKAIQLLLGEPIAIRDPIAVRIRRQSGNHLLILSRDEAEGVGICVAAVVSILAQQPPNTAKIFIADFTLADSEWAERAEEIEEFFPHEVKVLSKQRSVAEAVRELYSEVKRRVDAPPDPLSIFFVLQGLQRMKVLRTDDDSFRFDDDSTTPSELLAYILREGPETGVHVIAWCDTYPNATRVADRRTMNEFGTRAGGVMSADDSMNFFDDAAASRIDKPHRLLFFDEERPGQLDKFRPYSMPPREWLKSTGNQMASRVKK
jgi:adenylate kinase family enzyme